MRCITLVRVIMCHKPRADSCAFSGPFLCLVSHEVSLPYYNPLKVLVMPSRICMSGDVSFAGCLQGANKKLLEIRRERLNERVADVNCYKSRKSVALACVPIEFNKPFILNSQLFLVD